MQRKSPEEAFVQTMEYFCYGEEWEDARVRLEYVEWLDKGGICFDFGIGEARYPIMLGMVNPDILIYTIDKGRQDISNDDLINQTLKRAKKHDVHNLFCSIADSLEYQPEFKELDYLSIDSDGSFYHTRYEIEKYFPMVKPGGRIFIQSYNLKDKYPGIADAVDQYVGKNKRYILGEQYHNTREIYVQS